MWSGVELKIWGMVDVYRAQFKYRKGNQGDGCLLTAITRDWETDESLRAKRPRWSRKKEKEKKSEDETENSIVID